MKFRLFIAASSLAIAASSVLGQSGTSTTPNSSLPEGTPYVASMTFDVIAARESKPDPGQPFIVSGGFTGPTSLKMTNNSMKNMLALAYGVTWHQIQGLPDWVLTAMYNVEAKSDEATGAKLAILTKEQAWLEKKHMMQALLADRFGVKVHWEIREAPIYDLLITKGGVKMRAGGSLPLSAEEAKEFGDRRPPEIYQRGNGVKGYELMGHQCHVAFLTEMLSSMMQTEVIDKTGLTGTYDFDLQYSQASDARREQDPDIWPEITEAVKNDLGLHLEHAKGPIKMLIVDHIGKLSDN